MQSLNFRPARCLSGKADAPSPGIAAKAVFLLTMCLFAVKALAGTLTEAMLSGQPLQYMKAGAIDGCGVRIVGLPASVDGFEKIPVLDVSFNAMRLGGGTIKGGLSRVPVPAFLAQDLSKAVEVPISGLWLRAPGGSATTPYQGKVLAASTPKLALMYATTLEPVLDLIGAMKDGKPIQIGFHVKSADADEIYFGQIKMTDAEMAQFAQCMREWSTALQDRTRANASKGAGK